MHSMRENCCFYPASLPLFPGFAPFLDMLFTDDPLRDDMEGNRLSDGIDVFGVGALRRVGAAMGIDFLGEGVEKLSILNEAMQRL